MTRQIGPRQAILLKDVLATEQLSTYRQAVTTASPGKVEIVQRLRERAQVEGWTAITDALKLSCHAQSAGISIFENRYQNELTWSHISGRLAPFEGRRFPMRHSMCGVALELVGTQLFRYPHKYFRWLEFAGITISEALVTPVICNSTVRGTIWVMNHRGPRKFNSAQALLLEEFSEALQALCAMDGRVR